MNQCSSGPNAQPQTNENKVNKQRMVRLVVVFLQNILKQKVINFDEVTYEIRQFCMEHNTVKGC